jgi:hypothetical protein
MCSACTVFIDGGHNLGRFHEVDEEGGGGCIEPTAAHQCRFGGQPRVHDGEWQEAGGCPGSCSLELGRLQVSSSGENIQIINPNIGSKLHSEANSTKAKHI